ncbi:hypothetical protein H4S08_004849 [Coemansia sp. RSA 1365]|nr:hypothetical protein H4S08_004849 [Coemansia sp. RSA 1365]
MFWGDDGVPILDWVALDSSGERPGSTPNIKSGKQMYPWVINFIEFVIGALDCIATNPKSSKDNTVNLRSLVTIEKPHSTTDESNEYGSIDLALTQATDETDQAANNSEQFFRNAFALIVVKRYLANQEQALRELVLHTRNIFATQHNRRFAWGLTICGTIVRACIFGQDRILVSHKMDISINEDRALFVGLLVNWAICDEERLGYDPTIRCQKPAEWEIDVFGQNGEKLTYYIKEVICSADSIIGQQTRWFIAEREERAVLIKDAWAAKRSSTDKIECEEVNLLQKINDKLAGNADLVGTYPRLEIGGVSQLYRSGQYIDDYTRTSYKSIDFMILWDIPVRIHTRIAMSPVGKPLQNVASVDELIMATYDAMAAHTAIVKRCGILHRDISPQNILIHRIPGNDVKGMLINFDHAVNITDLKQHPVRAGTPLYMSIGNLENSKVPRTSLDDWESLIYVLCWLGTFGANSADKNPNFSENTLPIDGWKSNDANVCVAQKQQHLSTKDTFEDAILKHFIAHQDYLHLVCVVRELYTTLFYNSEVSPRSRGLLVWEEPFGEPLPYAAQPHETELLDHKVNPDTADPFERRAEIAETIADKLLSVFKVYRDQAHSRIVTGSLADS